MAPMFAAGPVGATLMMVLGLSLMGLTYGPLGTVLSELFPTAVRYTGSSLDVQFRGNFWRVAGALHRHLAGDELRSPVRRLLPLSSGRAVDSRVAGDERDQGSAPLIAQGRL